MWSDHEAFKGKGPAILESGSVSSAHASALDENLSNGSSPPGKDAENHSRNGKENDHATKPDGSPPPQDNNDESLVSPPRPLISQHTRGLVVRLWKPVLYINSTGRKAEQQAIGPLEFWQAPQTDGGDDADLNQSSAKLLSAADYKEQNADDGTVSPLSAGFRDERFDVFVDMAYLLNDKGEVFRLVFTS
jgi:hypothetical protein